MVIVKEPKRGRIGPSLRGLFYAYEQDGKMMVKSWPKKRGKPKTENQAQAQAIFKQACDGLKRMPAPFLNFAREQAQGTPMLPRDYLMAAGYGRGQTLKLPNGERRYWMATKVDLSILMDNIGDEEGMLLVRGTQDLWIGLAIGESGQVLTVDDDLMPYWAEPQGGAGGQWRSMGYGAVSGRAFCSKGIYFQPQLSGELDRVSFRHDLLAGQDCRVGVYRVTGSTTSTIAEILYDLQYTGVQDGTDRTATVIFDPPLPVLEETRYVVALRTVGAGGTYATRIMNGGAPVNGFPCVNSGGYAESTNDTPVVGSTFATQTGTFYHMNVRGSF